MKRKGPKIIFNISVTLVMVLVFSVCCWAAEPGITNTEVLFGMHCTLTGPAAWIGLGARDGLNMSFDEINNAGDVHGRKLKFITEDDENSPAKGISAARKLVELNKVFSVICGSGSTPTIAVSPIMREYQIPYFNPVAANPRIQEPFSKYVFSGAVSAASVSGRSMADLAIRVKGYKKPAIMNETGEWPKSVVVGMMDFLKGKGIEPVGRQEFTVGDKDFSAQLLGLKKLNPDVVLYTGHFVEFAAIIRQAPELGFKTQWIADPASSNETVLKVAGEAAEGVISGWPSGDQFTDDPDYPMGEFNRRYKLKYPRAPLGRPNYIDLYLYADGYVIAEALKRAGRDLTREKFISALESIKDFVAGPSSGWQSAVPVGLPRTFSATDHWGTKYISFLQVKNGKYVKTGYRYGQ